MSDIAGAPTAAPAGSMIRTLLLVRHGETAWNREGRFQGQLDIPLSDVGRAQARALRERLQAAKHAHLYDDAHTAIATSDLCRARETAEIVFGAAGRTLHLQPALRELCYGVFEGLTRPEIDERFPGALTAWLRGDRGFAMEGGESRAALHIRVHDAVTALLAAVPHPSVAIVAHGGVMRQLLSSCFADRESLRTLDFGNTAAHVVRVESSAWSYGGAL
jgi:broad specificity phosphatase PhoE